ncbi:MAG TPA: hypothetical protein VN934_11060 [Candidatus Tumulicola sp.]|nr:hypothetical protein [Candidatus Tumulicola sp.]
MRAALACIALAILVVAITLHGVGNEPVAEAWANWTFVFVVAAALLPQQADDWAITFVVGAIRRMRGSA